MSQLKKEKAHGCGGVLLYCVVFKLYKCSYNIQYNRSNSWEVRWATSEKFMNARELIIECSGFWRCQEDQAMSSEELDAKIEKLIKVLLLIMSKVFSNW